MANARLAAVRFLGFVLMIALCALGSYLAVRQRVHVDKVYWLVLDMCVVQYQQAKADQGEPYISGPFNVLGNGRRLWLRSGDEVVALCYDAYEAGRQR